MGLAETARKLIDKNGCSIDLVVFVDNPPPNPDRPWRVEGNSALVQTVRGVFLSANRKKMGSPVDYVANDGTPSMEQRVIIAAQGLDNNPALKGELRVGSERWSIKSILRVAPDNKAIIYILQVCQ